MAGEFSSRFDNVAAKERYEQVVIHKNIWEEQGFKFDDGLDYYGLEMIIYKRLNDLGWLRFGRQPARANINWAREFYAHNASGENTVVNVRSKLIPAHSTTINEILDLPEDLPSIYQLMDALEDIDYNAIKDALCLPNTEWNITGKNPGTISRPNLLPKAKLWNTIVKRNIMPTAHNQTVDQKRLVLIHSIIFGTKFNVGEVIARELSEACKNNKGILAFPCLILALYRLHGVPTYNNDKYTIFRTGWDRKHYMKKMDVADAVPIQVAMPTPAQTEEIEAPAPAANQEESAESEPTPTLPVLRNQLQQIEARQIEFIAESKLFQTTLLQFLYDHFSAAKFPPAPTAPPASPAAADSTATPSVGAGETEEVHYSSNPEPDAFDWHTPYETQPPSLAPTPVPTPPTDIAEPSGVRKRKAPATRVIREDTPLDQPVDPPTTANPPAQPSPAKRRRCLHIILSDSEGDDDNNEDGSDDHASSRSLAF
ncbi:hypothetical protein V6N12_049914 [Hibiscus sabdariffa]|uniref:Putative plant transposon protein domain-containing protein n=1 Tax=Hibiscus sabdariffa TaxID=183260 RepID=A0ABR2GAY6_9ROSI